jgi:drug/metabolite transporter (DMT)-like permease
VLPVLLALGCAVCYGGSDYTAGRAGRRSSVLMACLIAEVTRALLVVTIVPLVSSRGPAPPLLAWGAAAGVCGAAGSMALIQGFSKQAFRVASAISAVTAAVVSVLAGLLLGERLSPLSLAGMALALPAIIGVSMEHGDLGAVLRQGTGVRWGLAAGAGFGLSLIALNRAGSAAVLWPLAAAEVAAVATIGSAAAVIALPATGKPALPPAAAARPALLSGVTAAAGMFCYFIATHLGLLAVTAVIYSYFPAVTIVLAWRFDQEKLTRAQFAGLGLAAASIGLITIGGGR